MTEEKKVKKKFRKTFKVVAIECETNTTSKGLLETLAKPSRPLKEVARELEKTLNVMSHKGYTLRVEEYPQGILITGNRPPEEVGASPRGIRTPFGFIMMPSPSAVESEVDSMPAEHGRFLSQLLHATSRVPKAGLGAQEFLKLVAEASKGMPPEKMRAVILDFEKVAAAHLKSENDPTCEFSVRVQALADALKGQMQLQVS